MAQFNLSKIDMSDRPRQNSENPLTQISPAPLSPARIFVADDSPDTLELIFRSLQNERCRFRWAQDGYEAVTEMVRHPQVDLMILDFFLPGLQADEVLRELDHAIGLDPLRHESWIMKKVPVVIFSAASLPKTGWSQMNYFEVVDVWQKPLGPDVIRARVKKLLFERRDLRPSSGLARVNQPVTLPVNVLDRKKTRRKFFSKI
ncbi:MAG: two-component system response regulator [Bdellovibrio sp.]|jgi:CheY-like chemotaxis protein